ncbi:MAG: helix-turn-helix transcriptional regulator [Lachnospiraceae bacterium]|nr:helix-turn-helix transcriptional regulator [Lachnospiraceae bacterium]
MKYRVIDPVLTGKKIQQMCRDKGLKVKDIQEALQLESLQSVYKWFSEKSSTIPSIDHLVMLAMLLDCSIEDMLVLKEVILKK